MKRVYYLTLLLLFNSLSFYGQSVTPGTELQELARIGDIYQALPSLSFTMRITYADSLSPSTNIDTSYWTYQLSGGKALVTGDSTEFLRGRDYYVFVDKLDSSVSVIKNQNPTEVFQLPLLDSLFRQGHVDSMYITEINDSLWDFQVRFKEESQYLSYSMLYDPGTTLVQEVNFRLRNSNGNYDADQDHVVCVRYVFSSYSTATLDPVLFNEARFFYFLNDQLYLVAPWTNYQLITR